MVERVLIMAGGTGGHVFPALAVADAMREQGIEVSWMGTRRGLEAAVVPAAGFEIDFVAISGVRGKRLRGWLLAPFKLSVATVQAIRILLRRRPAVVLGMGGFVTGPGGVASWLLRRPLVIHEQNAIPGVTNQLLARLASRVLEAFPDACLTRFQAVHTGNPIRREITAVPDPDQRFRRRTEQPLRILVIGGSLGAQVLNEMVPQAVALLPRQRRPQLRHQAGKGKDGATRIAYRESGVDAQVEAFVTDMAEAYGWADLVICRAGALTVSELAAVGVGSLLVPYPYAVDDHQTHNAMYLEDSGAAVTIPQSRLTVEGLADLLREFVDDAAQGRKRLGEMAVAARRLAKPDATRQVMEQCLEVARG